jgi:hypothetical protein
MRLIGLCGMAGSGKDEAARALVANGWRRDAFADRMRTAMLALDPWVDDPVAIDTFHRLSWLVRDIGWDEAKRRYPEVRQLLQRFGTEAGRGVHGEDCWVDALFRDADDSPLVVTDVRFGNEARAIKDRGGLVVKIVRPGIEPLPGNHASEAGIPDELVDWILNNDSSIEMLHAAILGVSYFAKA